MEKSVFERRKFLRLIGLSGAGLSTASALAGAAKTVKEGRELAKEEIDNLKSRIDELDGRSKLILRLMLAFSGLDLILTL